MENIKDIVKVKLENYPNKSFLILINHKTINLGDADKPRYAYAQYHVTQFKRGIIRVGLFRKEPNGKLEIYETDNNTDYINDILNSNYLDDRVDLSVLQGEDEPAVGIQAVVNPTLGILAITTDGFTRAKAIVSSMDGRLKEAYLYSGRKLDVSYSSQLYDAFVGYSLRAYNDLVSTVLLRKLRASNYLKFYFLLDSFVPVCITSTETNVVKELVLYNPYMNIKAFANKFKLCEIIDEAENSKVTLGDYEIYFGTSLEICKGFNLKKFVPFTTAFYLDILAGTFSTEFPNPLTNVYVYDGDEDELTRDLKRQYSEEAFNIQLDKSPGIADWLTRNYRPYNSLHFACIAYSRQKGLGKGLNEIMQDVELKPKQR